MLDMNKYTTKAVADNVVVVNGVKYTDLTDEKTEKIMAIIFDDVPKKVVSTELHIAEPKAVKKQTIVGKVGYEDDFTTVTDNNGEYRLYIHCPVRGDKGDKIRYAIKANAKKDFGATFGGNFDSGDIYWVFPNKTKANGFVKARKDYAKANAK